MLLLHRRRPPCYHEPARDHQEPFTCCHVPHTSQSQLQLEPLHHWHHDSTLRPSSQVPVRWRREDACDGAPVPPRYHPVALELDADMQRLIPLISWRWTGDRRRATWRVRGRSIESPGTLSISSCELMCARDVLAAPLPSMTPLQTDSHGANRSCACPVLRCQNSEHPAAA